MQPQRSPTVFFFGMIVVLLIFSLACGNSASVPAQYVYWQAATDTPTPLPDPEAKRCPAWCEVYDPRGGLIGITPECDGKVFEPYTLPCTFEEPEEIIGPTQTPYFRHYQFDKGQPVNLIGGLIIRFEGTDTFQYNNKHYYILRFKAWNNTDGAIGVLYPYSAEIREVVVDGKLQVGRWTADEDSPEVIKSYCTIANRCTPLLGDEDTTDIHAGASEMDWIAVVQAPPGKVENYLLGTDPFSVDPDSYIIFRDQDPPDFGSKYNGEMKPQDHPTILPFPTPAYYDVTNGGSSYAWAASGNLPGIVNSGPATFDYTTFINMHGPMLPLKTANITQEYGCSNFGTPNTCAYPSGGGQCKDVTPKCKDWATGEPTVGWHNGVDFGAGIGTPIYAALPGDVTSVAGEECADVNFYDKNDPRVPGCKTSTRGYGFHITIVDDNGYKHLYAHLSARSSSIYPGARVERGQMIAQVGNSGWSTGPHLHYTVYTPGGSNTNPFTYLENAAVSDSVDGGGDDNPSGDVGGIHLPK